MSLAIRYALGFHVRHLLRQNILFTIFLSSTALLAQENELELVTDDIALDSIGLREADTVFLPIPIVNPTVGTGLAAVVGRLYQLDENAPSSYTGIGGFYTDSGSWGLGIGQKTYLVEDRLRVNASVGYAAVNYDFFGIGNGAGDLGIVIPIEHAGYFFKSEVYYRVWDQLYLGIGFRYANLETTIRTPGDRPLIPELQLNVVTSGVRILAQYDTRDNALNPNSGTYFEFNSNFARRSLGGSFDYEQFSLSYNKYFPIAENMVIAMRVSLCHTSNVIPFFELCLFGTKSDLRGYVGGQYRDRNLVAAQVEYRWQFYERFGMVTFAGIGGVARKFSAFKTNQVLPSAGLGLRYLMSEEHQANIGFDFAFGRDSQAFYFRIGEAF